MPVNDERYGSEPTGLGLTMADNTASHGVYPERSEGHSALRTAHPPAQRASRTERWSWALYDFSNTIWSMNVVSLYLATWMVVDLGASNAAYSWATSISSIIMAISVPLLGAISDATHRRKPWVVWFTIISCVATGAIGYIGLHGGVPRYGVFVAGGTTRPNSYHLNGMPLLAIAVAFSIANYAYQAAQPFYNAMLPELDRKS